MPGTDSDANHVARERREQRGEGDGKEMNQMPGDAMESLEIPLDRDSFMRTMIRELSGALQDVVGLDQAAGFVSVVGQQMGRMIDADYRKALGTDRLTRAQVAAVLVDLKRRINGDFFVISEDDDRIVLGNRACPFAEKVDGRPALCMMTSNVFGSIVADNLGYANVELEETIAEGAPGCRVVVHLKPTAQPDDVRSREYYKADATPSSDAASDA